MFDAWFNRTGLWSVGKTKRDLETRVEEHFRNIKNGEIEKPAVAAHGRKEKHPNFLMVECLSL